MENEDGDEDDDQQLSFEDLFQKKKRDYKVDKDTEKETQFLLVVGKNENSETLRPRGRERSRGRRNQRGRRATALAADEFKRDGETEGSSSLGCCVFGDRKPPPVAVVLSYGGGGDGVRPVVVLGSCTNNLNSSLVHMTNSDVDFLFWSNLDMNMNELIEFVIQEGRLMLDAIIWTDGVELCKCSCNDLVPSDHGQLRDGGTQTRASHRISHDPKDYAALGVSNCSVFASVEQRPFLIYTTDISYARFSARKSTEKDPEGTIFRPKYRGKESEIERVLDTYERFCTARKS
ncbi:hypothetical protein LXL04_006643 [Taraxacum kok-saghyz]